MQPARRPNVILILVDDMGFADLGITGSEIRTPNLDALARGGALLTSMYNCARCCPTRAALLTGLYPHAAGIGHMGTDLGTPAYQGFLRNDAATIAEVLRADGYRTLMSGKWHVGGDFEPRAYDTWRVGDVGHPSPRQRGFDRFYGILDGATHFWSPHFVMEDDRRVSAFDEGYYFTDVITDKAIGMVEDAVDTGDPFLLYLAHAAPHWPLYALPEDIARYDGVYACGWDAIRTGRHETLNATGVLQAPWDISPRDADVRPWESETHKDWEASKMATYAAMVDRMDQSVGRMVAALKRLGVFDDTLILFLSDNGGCAEFMAEDGWAAYYPDVTHDGRKIRMGNQPGLRPGDAQTYQSYDKPWANVSNAPFRLYKHYVHEGGISTPLIAHWPGKIAPRIIHEPAHVVDILQTILEATGSPMLSELDGHAIQPPQGESLMDQLQGRHRPREQPIFFEHEGNSAVRMGRFKLVRQHGRPWELYDMERDQTELHDLAGRGGAEEAGLIRLYDDWARRVGVIDWTVLEPRLLAAWNLTSVEG